MVVLIKILQVVLALSVLILIHEFGHFIFAKMFRIRVEKFYLFFDAGFALFRFKPKNSETSVEKEDASGNIRSEENLYMNGPAIYAFTLRTVPDLISETLVRNDLTMEQIDYVVLHQANKLVLTSLRDKLDIPDEKFCIDVEELGNTVSSTIPIAIKRAMTRVPEKFHPGSKILIAGFGVGYSWGGTVITMDK